MELVPLLRSIEKCDVARSTQFDHLRETEKLG